jgi:hypothetical protein
MDREPAVAGRFYRDDAAALAAEVDGFLASGRGEGGAAPAIGLIAPHAGYVYSGAIAGEGYARVRVTDPVLVLGPNHTGLGAPAALWPDGRWHTPIGDVPVDPGLTAALADGPGVQADETAHRFEHSLEVQVPFLQRSRPGLSIAALCLSHLSLADCRRIAATVASATSAGTLVVASSDMSHYLPAETARALDRRALDRILALDPEGLYEVVHRERITMCGIVPATVMLLAARERGATRAELVRYGNSGEASGDMRRVVGYAAVVVR